MPPSFALHLLLSSLRRRSYAPGPLPSKISPAREGSGNPKVCPRILCSHPRLPHRLTLQVEELLAESRVDYGREAALNELIEQLRRLLLSMTKATAVSPVAANASAAAHEYLERLGLPTDVELSFQPPSQVAVVGSYATRAVARPDTIVDVAVEMPAGCFQPRDHLGHRYHAKRALYLTTLAQRLSREPSFAAQSYGTFHGDPRLPTLVLHPTPPAPSAPGSVQSKPPGLGFKIRLLPCIAPDTFPAAKLEPSMNNVRSALLAGSGSGPAAPSPFAAGKNSAAAAPVAAANQPSTTGPAVLAATPHYNATILGDMLCLAVSRQVEAAVRSAPRLAEALVLFKVWARQHGVGGAQPDGISSSAQAALLCDLLASGQITAPMGPLQMVRAALQRLSGGPSSLQKGIFAAAAPGAAAGANTSSRLLPPPPPAASFKAAGYEVVLVEPTGWLNVTANVSRSMLAYAAAAAKRTLDILDKPLDADQAFAAAFLSPASAADAFDYQWRVSLPQQQEQATTICQDRILWR